MKSRTTSIPSIFFSIVYTRPIASKKTLGLECVWISAAAGGGCSSHPLPPEPASDQTKRRRHGPKPEIPCTRAHPPPVLFESSPRGCKKKNTHTAVRTVTVMGVSVYSLRILLCMSWMKPLRNIYVEV